MLFPLLALGLADASLKAALSAAKALAALVPGLESGADVKHFRAVLPAIFALVDRVLQEQPDAAAAVLELFELALESEEPLLDTALQPLVERLVAVAGVCFVAAW